MKKEDLEKLVKNLLAKDPTALYLERHKLDNYDMKVIAELLKDNKSITSLDLRCNKISDEGAKALVEALKDNKTLVTLCLHNNNIGYEGMEYLADVLKINKSITTINLSSNNIGDEGAKAIADALKTNDTITSLNLRGNKISDEGVKALAEALKVNKTLATLGFWGDKISDEGTKLIDNAIGRNKKLVKDLADLLNKCFITTEIDKVSIDLKHLKFFQVCDKTLLKEYMALDHQEFNYVKMLDKLTAYTIKKNYDNLQSVLSKEGLYIVIEKGEQKEKHHLSQDVLTKITTYLPVKQALNLWNMKIGEKVLNDPKETTVKDTTTTKSDVSFKESLDSGGNNNSQNIDDKDVLGGNSLLDIDE
jgi:Ran GTPase-activating protein (RanGAP) involved in mRNA processing and transport